VTPENGVSRPLRDFFYSLVRRYFIMARDLPEADWKACRKLQAVALERFCERIVNEVGAIVSNNSVSYHTRYLDLFKLIERRDHEIARAFNDPKRSNIVLQIATIVSHGLLTQDELKSITPEIRKTVESLSKPVRSTLERNRA
jgi:hypothetical protein